jgi:hypothetical protein
MLVQQTLPGFARPTRPRPRRRPAGDPAVSESRARSDRRYTDWREAFVEFLRRLPAHRRAELRRRLRPSPVPQRREAARAA